MRLTLRPLTKVDGYWQGRRHRSISGTGPSEPRHGLVFSGPVAHNGQNRHGRRHPVSWCRASCSRTREARRRGGGPAGRRRGRSERTGPTLRTLNRDALRKPAAAAAPTGKHSATRLHSDIVVPARGRGSAVNMASRTVGDGRRGWRSLYSVALGGCWAVAEGDPLWEARRVDRAT